MITAAGMRLQILRRTLTGRSSSSCSPSSSRRSSSRSSDCATCSSSCARRRSTDDGLSSAVEPVPRPDRQQDETATPTDSTTASRPAAPETRLILYRIVQEALTNVRKHAQAATATHPARSAPGRLPRAGRRRRSRLLRHARPPRGPATSASSRCASARPRRRLAAHRELDAGRRHDRRVLDPGGSTASPRRRS